MKKVVSVFSVLFFLAMFSTVALAADPVLYLDARNNPAHPDAWANLGTAGGELTSEDNPPVLEEGTIERPDLGIVLPGMKFYTYEESGQGFGGDGDEVELFLGDWTVEFLLRRNGEQLGEEHQLAGFQAIPIESVQGIRLNFWDDPDDLTFSIHAGGGKAGTEPLNIMLMEGEWNWIALVHTNGDSLVAYQNGVAVSEQAGWDFDDSIAISHIIIGANSYGERPRTFNGSIAIIRIYDAALSQAEILAGIAVVEPGAVDPASKLATVWGREKTR